MNPLVHLWAPVAAAGACYAIDVRASAPTEDTSAGSGVGAWGLAAAGSAALMGLAQPPAGVWLLGAVALAPWFAVVGRGGLVAAVAGSFVVGLAVGCVVGAWVPAALVNLGASRIQGVLGLLAITFWAKGVWFALLGVVVYAVRGRPDWVRTAVAAAATFAMEWWLSTWHWGVPWALLGHSQATAHGVAQLAVAGGVPLISALMAAVSYAAWLAIESRGGRSAVRLLAALVAAWGALVVAGVPLAEQLRPSLSEGAEEPHRLLVVQPNLPRGERWAEDLQALNLKRVGQYTERALEGTREGPAVVLWPENLVTSPVDGTEICAERQGWVDRIDAPVILGAARKPERDDPRLYRSSVLWLVPGRGVIAAIDKTRAVPILESATGFWGAAWVQRVFGQAARWEKVEEAAFAGPLHGAFTVTPVLCYEAHLPSPAARRRSPDSVAILNLSDDSWVAGAMATRQLTAFASFRAIEQRLGLIRVAHGGLSVVVDAFGRQTQEPPLHVYAHAWVEVRASPLPTATERAGIVLLPLATGGGVWWLLRGWTRRGREESSATRRDGP